MSRILYTAQTVTFHICSREPDCLEKCKTDPVAQGSCKYLRKHVHPVVNNVDSIAVWCLTNHGDDDPTLPL